MTCACFGEEAHVAFLCSPPSSVYEKNPLIPPVGSRGPCDGLRQPRGCPRVRQHRHRVSACLCALPAALLCAALCAALLRALPAASLRALSAASALPCAPSAPAPRLPRAAPRASSCAAPRPLPLRPHPPFIVRTPSDARHRAALVCLTASCVRGGSPAVPAGGPPPRARAARRGRPPAPRRVRCHLRRNRRSAMHSRLLPAPC